MTKDDSKNYAKLIEAALNARKFSHSPYSKFKVGAAALGADGKIYTGANIENAAYPATICAERVAFSKAISEGIKKFKAVAITSSGKDFAYPCGVCRQFMSEFSPNMTVILALSKSKYKIHKLSELLPHSFSIKDLQ